MTSRPTPAVPGGESAISETQVEVAIARIAAGFGALFFLQSLLAFVPQAANLHPLWAVAVAGVLASGLVVLLVGTFVGWRSSRTASVFALAYFAGVVSWPFAVIAPARAPAEGFWLHDLLIVAVIMAVIAFPPAGMVVYLVLVPALVTAIRVLPPGGGVRLDLAVLDAVYAVVLGGLIAIFSTTIRGAARSVGRARATALSRYAQAVRHHATEAERVAVDAIVHDSVLTTLLIASRAATPDTHALVAQMAEAAIRRLDEVGRSDDGSDHLVTAAVLAARIRAAAASLVPPVPARIGRLPDRSIPRSAAEALVSAAEQAMINSLHHAGDDAERWVALRSADGSFELEVGDDGVGFSPAEVPVERLGLRVSIVDRVVAAGGRTEVASAPGAGTRILLVWPDGAAPAAPSFEDFETAAEAEEAAP